MLYQTVRPNKFEDMIGNEAQVKALATTLSKPNHAHAYLLTGPSGCGKTTAARIAAQVIGADEFSITEINAANDRGIDTARQIVDAMRYGGNNAKGVSVFIIDEAHKTTKEFQNALLKPLEDVPPHVYFFLCTTEPAKLLPTIKTRCEEVKFKAMSVNELSILVRTVNRNQALNVCKEALLLIAENCDSSARLALVMLEKTAALTDPAEQIALVKSGIVDEENAETIDFCRALLGAKPADWSKIAGMIKNMDTSDPEKVRYAVLGYMNSVLLNKPDNRVALILEFFAQPFYNSGKSGITLAAYQSIFA